MGLDVNPRVQTLREVFAEAVPWVDNLREGEVQAREPVPVSRPARDRGEGQAHPSGREHLSIASSREDAAFVLFYFSNWSKARAMQHWIDRSGIAHRPMLTPLNGSQLGMGE